MCCKFGHQVALFAFIQNLANFFKTWPPLATLHYLQNWPPSDTICIFSYLNTGCCHLNWLQNRDVAQMQPDSYSVDQAPKCLKMNLPDQKTEKNSILNQSVYGWNWEFVCFSIVAKWKHKSVDIAFVRPELSQLFPLLLSLCSLAILKTRSLGAPTSCWRPFGPLDFVLRGLRALRPVRWARLKGN